MSDYTPNTKDMRTDYALGQSTRREHGASTFVSEFAKALQEFDRWLNQVKTEARDEGAREALDGLISYVYGVSGATDSDEVVDECMAVHAHTLSHRDQHYPKEQE